MMETTLALTFHILGAVVWVGGMFAAYVCLRPAAGALEGPQRLRLWRSFFAKFLPWVWVSVLLLLAAVSYWRFGAATHFTRASMVPHWSLNNAVFWSGVFFAFSAIEAVSAMGDEIQNPRRAIPWAILVAGCILAVGYIGGTGALMVALPTEAVGGPDGFVNGIRMLSERLDGGSLLAPMALLVGLNAIGGAAGNLSSTARLPFVWGGCPA